VNSLPKVGLAVGKKGEGMGEKMFYIAPRDLAYAPATPGYLPPSLPLQSISPIFETLLVWLCYLTIFILLSHLYLYCIDLVDGFSGVSNPREVCQKISSATSSSRISTAYHPLPPFLPATPFTCPFCCFTLWNSTNILRSSMRAKNNSVVSNVNLLLSPHLLHS
jgi:hypothetical protein